METDTLMDGLKVRGDCAHRWWIFQSYLIVGFDSEGKRGIFPSAYVSKLTRSMLSHDY
jgi:hypothetical protein